MKFVGGRRRLWHAKEGTWSNLFACTGRARVNRIQNGICDDGRVAVYIHSVSRYIAPNRITIAKSTHSHRQESRIQVLAENKSYFLLEKRCQSGTRMCSVAAFEGIFMPFWAQKVLDRDYLHVYRDTHSHVECEKAEIDFGEPREE